MKPHEIISAILRELKEPIKVGTKLMDIERHAEELVKKYDVTPFNKGYKPEWANTPYPYITCINVNSIIAHGKPSEYVLQDGDLVSVDTAIVDKYGQCADAAFSMGVGELAGKDRHLLFYANQIIFNILPELKTGVSTEYIAGRLENYALSHGYLLNRRFAGHRIADQMHMKPNIYNTPEKTHSYATLERGQVFCIEPMLTYSQDNMGVFLDNDLWTAFTRDQKNSCFFEAMIEITDTGGKMLTTHFDNFRETHEPSVQAIQ